MREPVLMRKVKAGFLFHKAACAEHCGMNIRKIISFFLNIAEKCRVKRVLVIKYIQKTQKSTKKCIK